VLKGFQTAPEISLRLLQTSADGFLELQRRWIERLKKIGMPSDAYSFSDLDSEFLNRWTDLYKNEFRQFLNIPQLGLTKFYQEKINQTLDKYNLFHAAMAEFLHLLSIPMERSFRVLQEKLAELTQTGKLPQDSKQYYQMWIKILEGHYMTLFQSSQYTETMSKTLDALGQFLAARNEVLEDAFKLLPVCTHRDVDEINREIYQLKRRLRALEKAQRDPTTD
jgi:polyhydroxyalkanoate synthase subunit PhaE